MPQASIALPSLAGLHTSQLCSPAQRWVAALAGLALGVAIDAWAQPVPDTVPMPLEVSAPMPVQDPLTVSLTDLSRQLGLPLILAWIASSMRASGIPIVHRLTEEDRALLRELLRRDRT